MIFEMVDPVGRIFEELNDRRATQESVAITYCFIMRQLGTNADWAAINAAIRERWKSKSALERIKQRVWAYFEGRA